MAKINLFGAGAVTISAPVVLGSSAALHIATDARNTTTGAVTLSGNNTFAGGVEIWGGTIVFNPDNQLGNSNNGIVIKGGVLNDTTSPPPAVPSRWVPRRGQSSAAIRSH